MSSTSVTSTNKEAGTLETLDSSSIRESHARSFRADERLANRERRECIREITKIFQGELWGNVTKAGLRGNPEVDRIVNELLPLCSRDRSDLRAAWPQDLETLRKLLEDTRSLRDLVSERLSGSNVPRSSRRAERAERIEHEAGAENRGSSASGGSAQELVIASLDPGVAVSSLLVGNVTQESNSSLKAQITKVFQEELWGRVSMAGLRGIPEVERILKDLLPLCTPQTKLRTGRWSDDPEILNRMLKDAQWLSDLVSQNITKLRFDRPEWNDPRSIPQQMTIDQIAELCYAVGFRGEHLAEAIAISRGESSWTPRCNAPGAEDSRGLFQINYGVHRQYEGDALYQPLYNARVAYEMSEGGKNWRPWTVYTRGIYRKYIDEARIAAARVENSMKERAQASTAKDGETA